MCSCILTIGLLRDSLFTPTLNVVIHKLTDSLFFIIIDGTTTGLTRKGVMTLELLEILDGQDTSTRASTSE